MEERYKSETNEIHKYKFYMCRKYKFYFKNECIKNRNVIDCAKNGLKNR